MILYNEFVQQAVAQIPWGHNIFLMDKISDLTVRNWYIEKTAKPIGISEYRLTGSLPEDLNNKLPSVDDIIGRV